MARTVVVVGLVVVLPLLGGGCARSPTRQPDASMPVAPEASRGRDAKPVGAVAGSALAGEETLGIVSLAGDRHRQFALRLTGCGDAGCALEVSVPESPMPPRTTLKWELPRGARPGTVDPNRVDDALVPPSKDTGRWQVGVEERAASVSATPMRFGPAGLAVALEMEAGFEHITRRHALVVLKPSTVASDRRILRWEKPDAAGPHATTLAALDLGDRDVPVYLDAFLDPSPEAPEALSASILHLDGATDTIVEESLATAGIGLPALVLGRFASAGAARKARGKAACLSSMLVLSAQGFDGESKRAFVMAGVGTSKPLVEQQARRLSSCGPGQKVRVSSWRGNPSVGE